MPDPFYKPLPVQGLPESFNTQPIDYFDLLEQAEQRKSRSLDNQARERQGQDAMRMEEARELLRQSMQQAEAQGRPMPGVAEAAGIFAKTGQVDSYFDAVREQTRDKKIVESEKRYKLQTALELSRVDPEAARAYAEAEGLNINFSDQTLAEKREARTAQGGGKKEYAPQLDKFYDAQGNFAGYVNKRDPEAVRSAIMNGWTPKSADALDFLFDKEKEPSLKKESSGEKMIKVRNRKTGQVEEIPESQYRR